MSLSHIHCTGVNNEAMIVALSWRPFEAPPDTLGRIEWRVRVRWHSGFRAIASVKADTPTVTVVSVDAANEMVAVRLAPPYQATLTVAY
jgi:hypothetical protein